MLVSMADLSVVMAACRVGRDSFAFEEEAISSWYFLLDYGAILRPIASVHSSYSTRHFGKPYLLSNPDELNILSDVMENKLDIRYTTPIINCHRHHKVFNAVCLSTVNIAFLKLRPKRTIIKEKSNRVLRMRVSGKKQDGTKQNNGWLCSTKFQRIHCKYRSKLRRNNRQKQR